LPRAPGVFHNPPVLTLSDISKRFGGRTLFEGVSLALNREDRVGLVGPNGAGKSTLFSVILGHLSPDTGKIESHRGLTIGHLPQESAPVDDETVLELATAITPDLTALRRRLRALADGHALDHDSADVRALESRFELLGGARLDARAKQILRGLAFRERDFERPAREMSGGWVMRAHLARLLVQAPDLLLLDEPTNHLDLEALLWFQDYLQNYPGAVLLVSHDRDFLNQLVNVVLEIRQGRIWRYRGNYDAYLEQREANEEQLLAAYKSQQREIARLQRFVDRFRAKNTKATQAQSKLKQIERMEKIEAPQGEDATVDFVFPQPQRSGLRVVTLQNVRFSYGSVEASAAPSGPSANLVYDGLEFAAERGQRIVLVGPNGAGKSTLLKLLAGGLEPQAGERRLGHNVKAGYYAQYRTETLHPELTVLEEAFNTPQRLTETFVRTVLGSFLFRGDDVFKRVSVLSGGEKSRLALVKLLLDPPNLLLMDEPTTHLDLNSVDALLYALDQFEGTLIFISHDVYFIRSLANHVVQVQDGRLTQFPGDYQYYLDKTSALRAAGKASPGTTKALVPSRAAPATTVSPAEQRRAQKRLEAEQRQARSRERKAQREEVARIEQEIAELEASQTRLTAELEDPATYQQAGRAVAINAELKDVLARLPLLTADWEAAATRLAELEADG
jgi:ATP-binding cassette subfamily F protein 3